MSQLVSTEIKRRLLPAVAMAMWLEFTIQTIAFAFYVRFAAKLVNMREYEPFSLRLTNWMLVVLAMAN